MATVPSERPLVVITGAAGSIGTALVAALRDEYALVGLDLHADEVPCEAISIDLTAEESVRNALRELAERHGRKIAAVVHLAAYFDFTGADHPLYLKVNVEGTRRLLMALQEFDVERFIYSGTMLVHRPAAPSGRIDESTPIDPRWAYPRSKAETEAVIRETRGDIPCALLHLAGLYDDTTAVPTLAHQIARIHGREVRSHLYPGDLDVAQSFVHRDDVVDGIRRTIERRKQLPQEVTLLIGEPDPPSVGELQRRIARLVHGETDWKTMSVPAPLARLGAWLRVKAEPIVPDAIDHGEEPFIRPFMVDLAEDHYALDVTRARELLGWSPQHDLRETLPTLIAALQRDPLGWYEANDVEPPAWVRTAADAAIDPEAVRRRYEAAYRREHQANLWAHFLNGGVALWLITSPWLLGYESVELRWSDVAAGGALLLFALLSLSWRLGWARWCCAAVGCWLMFAPLAFWAPTGVAYLNGTLIGMIVIGLAVLTRPAPGMSPVAACLGPTVPPGWDFSPSSWFQRLPIIALAFVGLYISRYLAAYQLGHIDGVWDPFFAGAPGPQNGTEEIITSRVSRAWPVPDAGLGAVTYALEILIGLIGSARRWRTMPWVVLLFGILIVPLGIVSITFIVIQPIVIGTWCTLCLVAAAAMLLQIPYALYELVATIQFLRRRVRAGQSLLVVLFTGDTDEGPTERPADDFARRPRVILGEVVRGGVNFPWNLLGCVAIGVWLMTTRLTTGAEGAMANADHVIGVLVLTVTVTAFAEVARPVRLLNLGLAAALVVTPFVFEAALPELVSCLVCAAGLALLSVRRGPIEHHFGQWDRVLSAV